MPLPQALARANRRAANRVIGRFAGFAPLFGIIVHRGRRSGRLYRNPLCVFLEADRVTFALTYGANVDWLKNVQAAGECWLIHRGRRIWLEEPRMLPPDEGRHRMPAVVRWMLRLVRADEFVELRIVRAGTQPGEG